MARGQGSVLRHHYPRDAVGRLIAKISRKPGSAARPDVCQNRFVYDAAGQLIQARNRSARVSLSYTAGGLLAEERLRTRGGQLMTLAHEYDAAGNRIATVPPDGRRLSLHRYGSGHVDRISLDDETVCEFERDALHRETVRSQGALRSYYERDALGRLLRSRTRVAVPGATSSIEPRGASIERQYEYDRAGQLLIVNDARLGRTVYRYDAAGRLLGADAPHARETFAFDPASNLIDPQTQADASLVSKRTWTEAEWQTYVAEHIHDPGFNPLLTREEIAADPRHWGEAKPNRLAVYQQHRYRYDIWGNCIEKKSGVHETRIFRWDAEHQLASAQVTRVERGQVIVEHWGYDYDPFGRRVAKYRLPVEERAEVALAAGNAPVTLQRSTKSAQALPSNDSKRHRASVARHSQARHGDSATHFAWGGNRLLNEREFGASVVFFQSDYTTNLYAAIYSRLIPRSDEARSIRAGLDPAKYWSMRYS